MKYRLCALALGVVWTLLPNLVEAGKPNTYIPVPLRVTVEDVDSSGAPTQIQGDGDPDGEYVDGVDGVAASIDQYGNLIIDNQSSSVPLRRIFFDYVGYSGSGAPPPDLNEQSGGTYLATRPAGTPLQNMTVGQVLCVELGWTLVLADSKKTQWRNSFHRAQGWYGFDVSQTSYAVVTRGIDASGDLWEVEPKSSPCNVGTPGLARVISLGSVGKTTVTDNGLYHLPFKLTLRRK